MSQVECEWFRLDRDGYEISGKVLIVQPEQVANISFRGAKIMIKCNPYEASYEIEGNPQNVEVWHIYAPGVEVFYSSDDNEIGVLEELDETNPPSVLGDLTEDGKIVVLSKDFNRGLEIRVTPASVDKSS